MSINVCFSTTDGFFSRLIRWFTHSKVSHSIITFRDDTLDRVFVMEANGRGFMLVPWSKWRTHNELVARYELSTVPESQLEALRELSNALGAEYDYVSILGFIWRRFMGRMKNPLDNPTKLVCSEAVAKFLYLAGLKGFDEPETWTPQDIMLRAQGGAPFTLVENGRNS